MSDQAKATVLYGQLQGYITQAVNNSANLQSQIGNQGQPNTVSGSLYWGREYFNTFRTDFGNLKSATPNSLASFPVGSSTDCRILRNDFLRLEDACYDPIYRLYVSLVLIAIMFTFCLLLQICLCYSFNDKDEPEKPPKPAKPYTDTVEDDVVDINDNEKVPIS